ncbi:peroxisome biogenesis factor 2 [Leptopilina heterotoma]|uniref:peroxisome biogenesis factor 2 n=1 Tax=Leptopilina heterotoma TaxID=63436 RepID=UPI001CA8C906|nr:peroxisome biogenesis factor 2 [Leptopilina heterotoma]
MPPSPYVSRINQIDAQQLDHEIYEIFRTQSKQITKDVRPGIIDKWQPEIDVFIKFLIWFYSLRKGDATFGQQLLNLKYNGINQRKAIIHFLLANLPRYIQERVIDSQYIIISRDKKLKNYFEWTANIIRIIELVNLILFLHRGTQPNLIERLLGISSQSSITNRPRNIGYSYMTRELLWHGLIELFTIGLPMVNFYYIKQKWNQLWMKTRGERKIVNIRPLLDLMTNCPHCYQRPILPRHAGCRHIFCYYCLQAYFTATDTFPCPECGTNLHSCNMLSV